VLKPEFSRVPRSASGGAIDLKQLAPELFDTLRDMSFDGVGISRETYGPGETVAMEVIERLAQAHGLETSWDAARNLIVRLRGGDPELPVIAT
jgi:beta-ureidopropionase / N-carbamoyl-L-amino-acid hydrolase